ncbi:MULTISPECIES: SixA phosphatase family protein [unclassified Nocardioides]|uniref:SixA phosphatase family protein n=1 Tax=unclassified Nocardioides TaxID=2615069 RepID=UPI001F44CAA2|nr:MULTISPECIES: histidine phosphatase family protein [unclassified Nocardioides]
MHKSSRILVLMRHAKAETPSALDHERELAPRGRREAALAGEWLRQVEVVPAAALVSSAARTQATWWEVSTAGGFDCPVETSDALYAAEPDSALDLIRLTSDDVRSLVVIGHNPTMAFLAQTLDDGEGDTDASNGMIAGFPTGAMAVFEVSGAWTDLDMGGARLARFHVPREDD